MTTQPRRRWFRFRLSTLFVLVAIVAWAMACRPYVVTIDAWGNYEKDEQGHYWEAEPNNPFDDPTFHSRRPNPRLLWPALALVAFLEWKLAMAVAAYRERRRAEESATQI